MSDLPANPNTGPRAQLIPIPRSSVMIWVNLAATLVIAAIGFGLGFVGGISAQYVILSTVVSVAVLLWLLNYIVVIFETRAAEPSAEPGQGSAVWRSNRVMVIAMLILLIVYLIRSR